METIDKYAKARKSVTFPYSLSSYDAVSVRPLAEFWQNKKPYLYCGSSSGPDGDFFFYYDVLERKRHTINMDSIETSELNHKKLKSPYCWYYGNWIKGFLKKLDQYVFVDKKTARDHGHRLKDIGHLVFSYNDEWSLYRFGSKVFRNIFHEDLKKI